MTCRYEDLANETADRINQLYGRVERFSAHPTLHTRVDGVLAEISKLEKVLAKQNATARWAKELRCARGYA